MRKKFTSANTQLKKLEKSQIPKWLSSVDKIFNRKQQLSSVCFPVVMLTTYEWNGFHAENIFNRV